MKNEKEKKRSNPLDRAKGLAQTFSDKLKHKKATRERTIGLSSILSYSDSLL
jgi:hypothetical protein